MTSPPGWLEPPKGRAALVLFAFMVPVLLFLALFYLTFNDPTALVILTFGIIMTVIYVLVMWVSNDPELKYTSKSYDKKGNLNSIAKALTARGVPFRRLGPGDPRDLIQVMDTFVIESERLRILVKDNLTYGLIIKVGPVDGYNKASVESIQRIVDEALGERTG
jgi:hypothetical protein